MSSCVYEIPRLLSLLVLACMLIYVDATRETHHTQSPFHQARSVPAGMKITVFDAWNGVALHPDDRHLTTFITSWGRYRYRVAPQGYVASGDGYSRRFDEISSDFPDKTKCIDDTLLWATYGPRSQLPSSDQVARLVWQKRHYPPPREVRIRSRHC